ncbi:hypothetical protein [Acinetobacter baumannii]|uniref:hypothetical protein n=1 Tax=Acinetobacter baumannii TaxID=470 RepID=UPI00406D3140
MNLVLSSKTIGPLKVTFGSFVLRSHATYRFTDPVVGRIATIVLPFEEVDEMLVEGVQADNKTSRAAVNKLL